MKTYGLTSTGFVKKDFATILQEIKDEGVAQFGSTLNTEDDGAFGILANIHASEYSELWDLAQSVYNSFYPDTAENVSLDGCGSIIGLSRLSATYSECDVLISGTPGTEIPITFTASVGGDLTKQFRPLEIETIGIDGFVSATMRAITTGAVRALAGTIDTIETPLLGVDSVTNLLDADEGRPVETDAEFRIRRDASLADPGKATTNAIRAKLLGLDGVEACLIFDNVENTTDGDGRPAHSFEAVILGGDDDEIAQTILDNKPIGIQTYGTETVEVYTDSGQAIDISFTRPTEDDIYLEVDLDTDSDFPDDGETTVLNDILDFAETLSIGDDVIVWKLQSSFSDVAGILGVTIRIGTAPGPTQDDNIAIASTHIASFDSSRITIAQV